MLHDFRLAPDWNRDDVTAHLAAKRYARVLDVGGSMGGWSFPYLSHYVDVQELPANARGGVQAFVGNVNSFALWAKVLADVEQHGKFDFAICTHTLEDLANPALVCELLPIVARRGFVAVPSKYAELRRHEGPWLGWIHHRWVFDKCSEEFVAWPKLSFVEHLDWKPLEHKGHGIRSELRFWWEDRFDLRVVHGDYMGPDVKSVLGYFGELLRDGEPAAIR